jgi:hypothetical protein
MAPAKKSGGMAAALKKGESLSLDRRIWGYVFMASCAAPPF